MLLWFVICGQVIVSCGMQSSAGKLIVSNSPKHFIQLKDSTLTFTNGAQMKLSNRYVVMSNNRFVGNGTVEVGVTSTRLMSTQILVNAFNGVGLQFMKNPIASIDQDFKPKMFGELADKAIVLRNNNFTNRSPFDNGYLLNRCDNSRAKTGLDAGCDPRAECTEPITGDVQCKCNSPYRFRQNFALKDGSKCELAGQLLDVFQTKPYLEVVVRKPHNRSLCFDIEAQSEVSFSAAIDSSAPYLLVGSRQLSYDMSAAKSKEAKEVNFILLGNKMNWSDSENATEEAFVSVSAPNAKDGAKKLRVSVKLAPYSSCQHTVVNIEGLQDVINHTETSIRLDIVAMDSDGFPIEKTPFNIPSNTQIIASLVYHSHSNLDADAKNIDIIRDAKNGSKYSAIVPPAFVAQAGTYSLTVKMTNAWDDSQKYPSNLCVDRSDTSKYGTTCAQSLCFCATNGMAWHSPDQTNAEACPVTCGKCPGTECVPKTCTFIIKCSPGYEADVDKNCFRINFNSKCEAAKVHMKSTGQIKASQKATAKIGSSDHLSVTLSGNHTSNSGFRIRLVPLKAARDADAQSGLDVTETGSFLVELIDHISAQSCILFSQLTIECDGKAGFEEHKHECRDREVTNRKLIMAIGVGTVLALSGILLLYLVRKNPARAKKILVCLLTRTHACTHARTCMRACMHMLM